MKMSFEIIKESRDAFKRRLALVLYLNLEFYLRLADTAEVLDVMERRCHADTAAGDDRHSKFHLVKTIVDEL